MAVLDVSPLIPDLKVPRAHPCQAKGIGPGAAQCGATPASLWRRTCLASPPHVQDVRICGTHAKIILSCRGGCAECLARGFATGIMLMPLDLLLLGHARMDALPQAPVTMTRA